MNKLGLFILSLVVVFNLNAQSNCVSEILSKPCVTFDVVNHGITNMDNYIFTWKFGDNTSEDGAIVNHCYMTSGEYRATLSLLNKENGGYFEDEIILEINIVDPIKLDIMISDSLIHGEKKVLRHSIELDSSKTVLNTKWLVDDVLFSEENNAQLNKIEIGQHKLRVELLLSDSLELCTEKIIRIVPGHLFDYETRFLRDRAHFTNDTLIWSGNQISQIGDITKLESVFFNLDSYQLTDEIKTALNANLDKLSNYQDGKLLIGTFTHTEGDFDRNRELSLLRSNAIKGYLKNRGMKEDAISIADPLMVIELKNTCSDLLDCDYLDENLNRRTDFKIVDLGANK